MNRKKRGRPLSKNKLLNNGLTKTQWAMLQKLGAEHNLPAAYYLREAVDEYLAKLSAENAPAGFFETLLNDPKNFIENNRPTII